MRGQPPFYVLASTGLLLRDSNESKLRVYSHVLDRCTNIFFLTTIISLFITSDSL